MNEDIEKLLQEFLNEKKERDQKRENERQKEVKSDPIPTAEIQQPQQLIATTNKKKVKDQKWWHGFFGKKSLKKTNKIAVIYLRNNGNAELLEQEPRNGFFSINGQTYHERADCIWTVTKDRLPMAIIREWDIIPIGTKRWEEEDMREKFAQLEEHVLKGIRHAELVKSGGFSDSKITPKQMIMWGIIAIIAIAVLVNYL